MIFPISLRTRARSLVARSMEAESAISVSAIRNFSEGEPRRSRLGQSCLSVSRRESHVSRFHSPTFAISYIKSPIAVQNVLLRRETQGLCSLVNPIARPLQFKKMADGGFIEGDNPVGIGFGLVLRPELFITEGRLKTKVA